MGIRAWGSGLTWNFVSKCRDRIHEKKQLGVRREIRYIPRSSKSPSIVTRSVAERRSSESIKQQRSISRAGW